MANICLSLFSVSVHFPTECPMQQDGACYSRISICSPLWEGVDSLLELQSWVIYSLQYYRSIKLIAIIRGDVKLHKLHMLCVYQSVNYRLASGFLNDIICISITPRRLINLRLFIKEDVFDGREV